MEHLPDPPRTIGDLLSAGFELFFAGLRTLLGLFVAHAAINVVISALLLARLPENAGEHVDPARILNGPVLALWFAWMIVNLVATAAYTHVLYRTATGGGAGVREALATGLAKSATIFISGALYAVATALGMLALVIPGIYVAIALCLGMYIVVIEDAGPVAALVRSYHLVQGNWWRTLGFMLVVSIIAIVLMMLVTVPVSVLGQALGQGNDVVTTLVSGVNELAGVAGGAFFVAMIIPLYLDLRTRLEGPGSQPGPARLSA